MKFVLATIHSEPFIGLLYGDKIIDLNKAEQEILKLLHSQDHYWNA